MSAIIDYYEKYDEENRLTTDNARKLEGITTTRLLDKHLGKDGTILDLGAGAGYYTFYYADRGYSVVSTDLTPKHVRLIGERVERERYERVAVEQADATDLSRYPADSFDAVLCLGPLYHLTDPLAQHACIRECFRVLKPGGLLAAAYVNRLFLFPHLVKQESSFLTESWVDRILLQGKLRSQDEGCFWTDAYFHTPDEAEALFREEGITILEHAASDGVGILMRDTLNGLSEEQFKLWTDYHLRTCSEPSLLGLSNHGLLIGRKEPRG